MTIISPPTIPHGQSLQPYRQKISELSILLQEKFQNDSTATKWLRTFSKLIEYKQYSRIVWIVKFSGRLRLTASEPIDSPPNASNQNSTHSPSVQIPWNLQTKWSLARFSSYAASPDCLHRCLKLRFATICIQCPCRSNPGFVIAWNWRLQQLESMDRPRPYDFEVRSNSIAAAILIRGSPKFAAVHIRGSLLCESEWIAAVRIEDNLTALKSVWMYIAARDN